MTSEFEQWLGGIRDRTVRARIHAKLDRLVDGNPGDIKAVAPGVLELRLDFGPGHRIYLMRRHPNSVILLCGGDKSSQRTDIRTAIELPAYWRTINA